MSDNNGDCGAIAIQSRCCSTRMLITPRAHAEPHRTESMRESGHLRRRKLERISDIDLAYLESKVGERRKARSTKVFLKDMIHQLYFKRS